MSPLQAKILAVIKSNGPMTADQASRLVGSDRESVQGAMRVMTARGQLFDIGKVVIPSISPRSRKCYSLEAPKKVEPKVEPKREFVTYGGDITLLAMISICRSRLMNKEAV